jgi:hypothetical protein
MKETDVKENLGTMTTQTGYEDVSIEELQQLVDDMSLQLRAAKQALRDRRLEGVNAAVAARAEADAELAEELKKLGYPTAAAAGIHSIIPNHALSTTLRNLYRLTNVRL